MNLLRIRIPYGVIVICFVAASAACASPRHNFWVTAYYGGWELGNGTNGRLPVSEVNFSELTDVIHFSLVPEANGSIDTSDNDITAAGSHALVKAAHANGVKVLISVGGWNTETGFRGATSPRNLTKFVMNLSIFASHRGYDGIDVDWEPLNPSDYHRFSLLIKTLRAALGPTYLLTTAAEQGTAQEMAQLQKYLNQINVMTYDLSFPSPGWITWYNGPLHQDGVIFPSSGTPVPACDNIIKSFVDAGIAKDKIGIGAELGGSVWKGGVTVSGSGVTAPGQAWRTPPAFKPDVPYYTIMKEYFPRATYHWNPHVDASYLSIDSAGREGDYFISFDDSSDIAAKVDFAERQGLGGIMLYELGMGYMGDGSIPLLNDIENAADSWKRETKAN